MTFETSNLSRAKYAQHNHHPLIIKNVLFSEGVPCLYVEQILSPEPISKPFGRLDSRHTEVFNYIHETIGENRLFEIFAVKSECSFGSHFHFLE